MRRIAECVLPNHVSVIDYFPLSEPRDKQVKACTFFANKVASGFRDLVIEAPTGIGKSAIGVALTYWTADALAVPSETSKGSYYLVTQKLLQDQLVRDMPRYKQGCNDGQLIKSAENYPCDRYDNCAVGGRAQKVCSSRISGDCLYKIQKGLFTGATLGITNYSYFFAERTYAGELGNRQLLIADECHTLEEQIINFVDGTVSAEDAKRWRLSSDRYVPRLKTLDDYLLWLDKTYMPEIKDFLATLLDIADIEVDGKKGKDLIDLDKHVCKLNRAIDLIAKDRNNWVYWQEQADEGLSSIVRPIVAAPFTADLIQTAAPVRVYMSAFPGAKEIFCRNLGLNKPEVAWLSLNSSFPVKNRQIIALPAGSMSASEKESTLPNLLKMVLKLAGRHKGQRGLIHCGSYDLGNKIYEALSATEHAPRILYPKKAADREPAFVSHSTRQDSILISPSMTEGFDFAGDLARWQIVAKIPYPYLGDKQIEAKMRQDYEWYLMRTVMTFLQACGRVCRSDTDYGVTYVLDGDFKKLCSRAGYMFPQWFSDAIVWP